MSLPASTSACQTASGASGQAQASCAGTADEVKTVIAYGANLLPVSVSSGAGDNSLTAIQAAAYDPIGNLVTVDGPLAGSADTVRLRYNASRELVGTVSPDPDPGSSPGQASGPLKHRAQRTTYRLDGQVERQEAGTVTDQGDAAWVNFVNLEAVETGYDANARPVTSKLVAGGTVHALAQASYDALGRPECSAVRMNPAGFTSLPASACSLGAEGSPSTGSGQAYGPDRIGKTVYDAAGQPVQAITALGTADEAVEVTSSYTLNVQLATLTDGENNKTSYEYDGHDRLTKSFYPVPTKGANQSSTTDYEELSYDAGSNVVSRRLRDGQSIAFGYDALNRLTLKDVPNPSYWESDVSYSYDNLGRQTLMQYGNGVTLGFGYDALGRKTSEASGGGTTYSAYDLAGRRTRLTYRDGFFVEHDYLVTGEMSRIRENGTGPVLAAFGYDDLGRRTSLTRGNGTVTSYAYDPASRLASLGQELGGASGDLTLTFGYNPAGQIVSNTRSNDSYAWTGHSNVTQVDPANGLNQATSVGSTAIGYDGRGNVTSIGSAGYAYTAENRMKAAPGANLIYDQAGRLASLAEAIDYRYDGSLLLQETQPYTGNLLHRYVHGPGVDEPLVWYEGTGTSDRRYLHADERGSIVSVSDSAGNLVGINSYDEYGVPASTNIGTFGYTGQVWIPALGMYYYKARMYNPTMGGRFMQPDPIGYAAGMNLNVYVNGDPVNFVDPWGLYGSDDDDEQKPPERQPERPKKVCVDQPGTRIRACFNYGDENNDNSIDRRDGLIALQYARNVINGLGSFDDQRRYRNILNALLAHPNVSPAVKEAIEKSLRYGWEYGFWIYRNNSGDVSTGSVYTSRSYDSIQLRNPCLLGCWFTSPYAFFHTHPYPSSGLLSREDMFRTPNGAFMIGYELNFPRGNFYNFMRRRR